MSDQADALNATLRAAGVPVPPPAPPAGEGGGGAGGEKPEVPVLELPRRGRYLGEFARDAGMIASKNGIFRRDRDAVTINYDSGEVEAMTPKRFVSYMEKISLPGRLKWPQDGGKPTLDRESMSERTAAQCLEADQFISLQRPLAGVRAVPVPVLRASGEIELLAEGYDAESAIFTRASKVRVRKDMPIAEARQILIDLHREFDFIDWNEGRTAGRSFAIQVCAMLSLWAAGLLPGNVQRAGFLHNANVHRAGKSLLVKIAVIPFLGTANAQSMPENEREVQNMLDSTARDHDAYLFIDDVGGTLRSGQLNAFMTSPTWSGRKFHSQGKFAVEKRTVVFVTGHSLTMTGDLTGRFLVTKIHIEDFEPNARVHTRTINESFLEEPGLRGDILSALFALVREWAAAGRPRAHGKLAGFEEWAHVYAAIVQHAGLGDPLQALPDDETPDTEAADMRTLVRALAEKLDGKKLVEFEFAALVEECRERGCFEWIIEGKEVRKKEGISEWTEFELTKKAAGIMGKLFSSKYGGQKFKVGEGKTVRFGHRGRNRHRKYVLELVA